MSDSSVNMSINEDDTLTNENDSEKKNRIKRQVNNGPERRSITFDGRQEEEFKDE
ncbi:hypothetical protein TcasGA2_TC003510 [Tribolium castaneum]|uniref:Uncharacterized protein n=1 Tax=Tribolium castaneum TaxID=7070 RepID=D6WHB5_TRICA|nr:hypothetical protein TcasGA2_TC003510 [Tribolium castaneum]